jgi:DNA-binding CsgD family transcriptional regulator
MALPRGLCSIGSDSEERMNQWCDDLIGTLPLHQAPQRLLERVVLAAQEMGFEYCAVGVRLPYPLSNPRVELFNNYPKTWQAEYAAQRYLARDPSVAHGSRNSSLCVWDDRLFAGEPEMWSGARSAGLCHGWFKSSLETCGAASMLTLARSSEPITAAELAANAQKMAWLATATHVAYVKALMPQQLREPQCQLTSREVEILRWTGDGKSSSEIADILTISDNTVNFHIKNAIKKLGTNNKTAAAVRAALSGLLNHA